MLQIKINLIRRQPIQLA